MRYFTWVLVLILLSSLSSFSQGMRVLNPSWAEIQKSRKGSVTIYWFENNPFGYKDGSGQLVGMEVDIMEGFQRYVRDRYKIDLSIQWTQVNSFENVLTHIKNALSPGIFGVGGFSISKERKTFMKFSPSYMADITVLVSTEDIPIIKNKEDLHKYLQDATAITAPGTLLEKDLLKLRNENKIDFKIEYASNSYDFLALIKNRKKSFGYLSLPVYLMDLNKGLTKLKRQNYLTKIYEGRGIGLPKISDWDTPMNEYFASREFTQNREAIIGNYINIDLYHFIEKFDSENEVSLLNKEKDIQKIKIEMQNLEIRKDSEKQRLMIVVIVLFSILLITIVFLFRNKLRDHRLLQEQNAEIEAQSDEIKSINDNLELAVQERTRDLNQKNLALEEYAFITAHKLRAPLARILGLVALLEQINLNPEDHVIIDHLKQSSIDLDTIIHSVMDAIEKADALDAEKEQE